MENKKLYYGTEIKKEFVMEEWIQEWKGNTLFMPVGVVTVVYEWM